MSGQKELSRTACPSSVHRWKELGPSRPQPSQEGSALSEQCLCKDSHLHAASERSACRFVPI